MILQVKPICGAVPACLPSSLTELRRFNTVRVSPHTPLVPLRFVPLVRLHTD
jgi:hypothetical protein